MQFRLLYEGPIAPRRRFKVADIHKIRMELHPQLKTLWERMPLSEMSTWFLREKDRGPGGRGIPILERKNNVLFAPLVTKRNDLACELAVTLLRQQSPGQLLGEGGDIDNRLKTLLDALRMPSTVEAQQAKIDTRGDNDPIHCLLQDDALVRKVSVETDWLLRPTNDPFDLVAIIQVRVLASRTTMQTFRLRHETNSGCASRLGHASIQMTADTYGHLFPRGDDSAELAAAEMALLR